MPVMLGMGLPLFPDKLCIAVCGRAGASKFLEVRRVQTLLLSVLGTEEAEFCIMRPPLK